MACAGALIFNIRQGLAKTPACIASTVDESITCETGAASCRRASRAIRGPA